MNDAPRSPRRFPVVAVATFFFVMGAMGSRPVVPLYAVELGIGAGEIGVLVAVFALIPLLLATVAGSWMDRHGMGRALVWSAAIGGLGLVLPFLVPGRTGLYLSQLVAGSGFTVFILAGQNLAGRGARDVWQRERSVAVFSLGVALGSLLGPLIGGLLGDHMGYGWSFLVLGLLSLLSIGFAVPLIDGDRRSEERRQQAAAPASLRNPLRILGYHPYMGRAFLVSVLILIAKDMYVAYFPLYALAAGLSASWVGVIIAVHNGGGVVMRFLMLPLVRLLGKNRLIMITILFSGACFLALPLTGELIPLAAISLLMGLGLGIGQPLSITRTFNLSPPDRIGEVLGFRLACNRFTQLVTPLVVGGLVTVAGVSGIFVIIGAILVAGSTRISVPAGAERPAGDRQGA